jgi:hypothetical protein
MIRRSGRVTLLDVDLTVPAVDNPTRCHVTATSAPDLSKSVVLVVDSAANQGVSAHLVFDRVVAAIRWLLPDGCEEPVWIHRWDERALASVVLRDGRVTCDHMMQPSADGWEGWPIPGRLTSALIG